MKSGTAARDTSIPLNKAVTHAVWLTGSASISNSGFPGGIAVQKGSTLLLSLWVYVKPGTGSASLAAELIDTKLGTPVASAAIATESEGRWVHLNTSMSPNTTSPNCRFELHGVGERTIGVTVVSLFPRNTFMGRRLGLREDVAGVLNESQPAFIRLPGGCYVEGQDLQYRYAQHGMIVEHK